MIPVVTPQSEAELAEIVRSAGKRTFEIVGRRTKCAFGRPTETSAVLDLSALSGITSYEPDELVITARAATPMSELEKVLAEKSQIFGFEPADWSLLYGGEPERATIGGVVSANACGSGRVRYGAVRDHLLGYRAVNGLGEAYKAGGRVVKNVTGFDLPKLVAGAMGTLGPLTELTLRVVPRAPGRATLLVRDLDADRGFALLRRVWSSPLEASGLSFVPDASACAFPEFGDIGPGAALIRVDGAHGVLADKFEALKALLVGSDRAVLDEGDKIFSRIGAGAAFADRLENVWRVFVPPAASPSCARELASRYWLADWAGGVLWVEAGGDTDIPAIAERAGGHAILMRADAETRRTSAVYPMESPARAALTRRVKAAFDPAGIFNPGRMFENL